MRLGGEIGRHSGLKRPCFSPLNLFPFGEYIQVGIEYTPTHAPRAGHSTSNPFLRFDIPKSETIQHLVELVPLKLAQALARLSILIRAYLRRTLKEIPKGTF